MSCVPFLLGCVWCNAFTTLGSDDYLTEARYLVVPAAANDFPFELYFNNLVREKCGGPGATQSADCYKIVDDIFYLVPILRRC